MAIQENHNGKIITRKCVREECNAKSTLNDYYFCPDCMIISKTIPFEVLHIIMKQRMQKIQNSKIKIASYNNKKLNLLYHNLEITLQSLQFSVFYQKEFFEEKQENDIMSRLKKSEIITDLINLAHIQENSLKSLSRFFTVDIMFTFEFFFKNNDKIPEEYRKKGPFALMESFFDEKLKIKSLHNPFLPLIVMRNSNHNNFHYKNTVEKKGIREKSLDILEYEIDSYSFRFEHGKRIEYGPLVHEFFLFDKCLEKLEQNFIPKFYNSN